MLNQPNKYRLLITFGVLTLFTSLSSFAIENNKWGDTQFQVKKPPPNSYTHPKHSDDIKQALEEAFFQLTRGIPKNETTTEGQRGFASDRWAQYIKNLTDHEKKTVRLYTEEIWYRGFARTVSATAPAEFLSESFKSRVGALDNVLYGQSADRDYIVQRRNDMMHLNDSELKNLPGSIISQPNFTSTALGQMDDFQFGIRVRLNLRVQKNAAVAYIRDLSEAPDEEEMLLPRNTNILITDAICTEQASDELKEEKLWKSEWTCGHWEVFGWVQLPKPNPEISE